MSDPPRTEWRSGATIDPSGKPQPVATFMGRSVYAMTEAQIQALGRARLFDRDIPTWQIAAGSVLVGLALGRIVAWAMS